MGFLFYFVNAGYRTATVSQTIIQSIGTFMILEFSLTHRWAQISNFLSQFPIPIPLLFLPFPLPSSFYEFSIFLSMFLSPFNGSTSAFSLALVSIHRGCTPFVHVVGVIGALFRVEIFPVRGVPAQMSQTIWYAVLSVSLYHATDIAWFSDGLGS